MSKVSEIINLTTPSYPGISNPISTAGVVRLNKDCKTVAKEQVVSENHFCNKCQGNGYFWTHNSYNEPVKEPCSMCGGTGVLDAIVTIEWKQQNTNK